MNKKKLYVILVIAFVALIAGAYVLYNKLSEDMKPEALTEQGTVEATADEEDGEAQEESQEDAQEETDSAKDEAEQGEQKKEAPDFTVYDIDGNAVKLSDFKGKPTIVNFWASWCGPCKSEMPDFNEVYLTYGEEINFLIVNMTDGSRETVETASAYIEEQGYSFPVYYDTEYNAAMVYGVSSLPTTYFIDAEGYLTAYAAQAINAEVLQQGIEMITTESQE